MQWYLSSLLMLLVLVAVGGLTGCLLTAHLPWRIRPVARLFLSVPSGWALLTLVATLVGWFGRGYAAFPCGAVTASLAAAGAWTGRCFLRHAGGDAVRLLIFCVVASFPVLAPLRDHGSFSLYNDTFLYLGQSVWLQRYPFWEPAVTDGGHPLWGTVGLMQGVPLRMGASFVLGWVQASFGLTWPHEVFPVVAALATICGALGLGATSLATCPGRRVEAWLAAFAAAVTVNGFAFGAANGFLPQTWGLAFVFVAFAWCGLERNVRSGVHDRAARWQTGIPIGMCAAASLHCYWDLLPLEAPALLASTLFPWSTWRGAWKRAVIPLLTCLVLMNFEWVRAVRGILYNLHAVAGNPVAWNASDYLAHALGLESSIWERSRWFNRDVSLSLGFLGTLVVAGASLTLVFTKHRWLSPPTRERWRWQPLTPALIWLAISVLLFGYFRWAVPSPWGGVAQGVWTDGTGQSWSQYKVTNWASLAVISIAATLLTAGTVRRPTWTRWAVVTILTAWCGIGLGWSVRLAVRRGEQLLSDVGVRREPLVACLAIQQQAAALPKGDWIYLDWPDGGRGNKLRQLMVYFLADNPLASDWATDSALLDYVTPEDAQRTAAGCQWILRYRRPNTQEAALDFAVGGMTLERNPAQPERAK